ncbi:Uncharacterized protein LARI1_G001253 [Lachnellula arida]|uniref:Uncharacterized protein n=1 Tax=Lachnellula arida TaxID=1316785 RepID=A0A8T9BLQ2_9HELO|nr:Uncharacterized protein LARI1_G001253 [Lachnellula arida]
MKLFAAGGMSFMRAHGPWHFYVVLLASQNPISTSPTASRTIYFDITPLRPRTSEPTPRESQSFKAPPPPERAGRGLGLPVGALHSENYIWLSTCALVDLHIGVVGSIPKLTKPATSFPAIRACIFDMDGLLINSEDVITLCINQLLEKYRRPPFTQSIRAQLMGVPNSSNSDAFHDWAKLPISREQFARDSSEQMRLHFPDCTPLPGAKKLVSNLSHARSASGDSIELALASSTKSHSYKLKTSRPETKKLLSFFQSDRRVLGDDARMQQSRGKPAPDIYLVALQALNSTIADAGEKAIMPNECLVFEDSIAGVEAGRRAGMRVVWVLHIDVAVEYRERQKDALAGRMGIIKIGDDWQLGEIDDGWAESIPNLESFDYEKYGINMLS